MFDKEEARAYNDAWQGMPEYIHEDLKPIQTVMVHFRNEEDRQEFSRLVGQKITYKTKSIWHPVNEIATVVNKRYVDGISSQE